MENKTFWQQLALLGANVYNNQVNSNAATAQSANTSTAIAGVVRFGIVIVSVYFAGKFILSLFKR